MGAGATRGDFLLSPIFLVSLLLLLINDFVLKPDYPSAVSGILSDLAGMVFFPVFFVAVAEFVGLLLPRKPLASPRWFWLSTAVIAFLFVTVKFSSFGQQAYEQLVAPLQGSSIAQLTVGGGGVVADPWDLLALILTPIPIWIGYRYRPTRNAVPRS